MSSWSDITRSIQLNSNNSIGVSNHSIINKDSYVERFPFVRESIQQKPFLASVVKEGPGTGTVSVVAPAAPVFVIANVVVEKEKVPTTIPVVNDRGTTLYEPKSQKNTMDPIVIGIDQQEPLYAGAPARTKHQIECEEAQRIEGVLPDLYKSQGGRSRGWTKTGLELFLKPRCASGGDNKELDRVKQGFAWQLVSSDKSLSAFLDFVCVAKRIRVAVWFSEDKYVAVYPAADYAGVECDMTNIPLYHIDSMGHPRFGLHTCSDLIKFCDANKFTLLPPSSVMHSLSTLTVGDLESIGEKLGMAAVSGNKKERVAKVASYKLRQRLNV